jgi:hypothetical protein
MNETGKLLFGIYPGGLTTTSGPGHTVGPPDNPELIRAALSALQPPSNPLIIRGYEHYYSGGGTGPGLTPADVTKYIGAGRKLDLVLCYHSSDGDMIGWTSFVRRMVRAFGPCLATLQVAEEPNNPDPATGGDGSSPNVRQAIIDGVVAAKDEATRGGYPVRVGFNAVVTFNPRDEFWPDIGSRATPGFLAALDYVGVDFFADVWRPIPPPDLGAAVAGLLAHFRAVNLAAGRIPPTVPLHVGENGWPTGPGRTEERQAEVVEAVVRAVHGKAIELNISAYEFFALRDADSSNPNLLYQFGLLRDDYSPKPAFAVYRRLIAELGVVEWSDCHPASAG